MATAGDTFLFELVSPERLLLSEQVRSVVVPGSEGEFEVLKNHAPFLTTLLPGILKVTVESGAVQRIFVRGGFADVNGESLTILAEDAVPVENLKPDQLAAAVRDAEEAAAGARESSRHAEAERHLAQLRIVQASLAA